MLKNLTTLITGAASGIGKATVKEFCKQGVKALVACDINKVLLEETCHEISKEFKDVKIIPLKVDITNRSEVENMVETTVKNFKILDVAFNNAGVSYKVDEMNTFDKQHLSIADKMIDINLKGCLNCMHYEVQQMKKQPKGYYSIINTASIAGLEGIQMAAAYNAAKAGIIGASKAVAMENGELGIRVNCVAPGYVLTPMLAATTNDGTVADICFKQTAMARPAQPEEISKAVVFLASKEASYICGHTLVVDGGWTIGKRAF